eukprot:snap_masked-scaffold816_size93094-processed-gene-0.5 protein:Tk00282 transcript:snap_masked-scaffold816_size93094-processed-gene-0.5-mRNA-1 annotation:"protein trc8 homolog"
MPQNGWGGWPAGGLDILLRLPPLYLMDQLLLRELGLQALRPAWPELGLAESGVGGNASWAEALAQAQDGPAYLALYERVYGSLAWALLPHLAALGLGLSVYGLAAFIITLSTRHLLVVYVYGLALLCLPAAFLSHGLMLEGGLEAGGVTSRASLLNYAVQPLLACLLASVLRGHFDRHDLLLQLLTLSGLGPNLWALAGGPPRGLPWVIRLALVLPSLCVLRVSVHVAGTVGRVLVKIYVNKREFVRNFGLNTFLETEWSRLQVPRLLRTFWLTRLALLLLLELGYRLGPSRGLPPGAEWAPFLRSQAGLIAQTLAVRGAETLIAVLGMTSIVSTLCHYVGSGFQVLLNADDEEEKSVASVSAVLFFVLALQTGITSLEPQKRFARLCKNLYLLLTALFHFIHNMVGPVLMSLSASRQFNSRKHLRALAICLFLVLAPLLLMAYLWQTFTVGTWLLSVTAFCIEVIVKVCVTVSVYLLFVYDHYCQEGTWEQLDDAVYYVKAVGNTVEFCFAVFLFFNGGWILMFESGGTIRALMMLIHAYCNIWCEAKAGWQTFIKRRTAVAKINGLPDASPEQLEEHNDVCAICYQDMQGAKVTRCRHFFHGVCLRKWLYVQDTCPLCHSGLNVRSGSVDLGLPPRPPGEAQAGRRNLSPHEIPLEFPPEHVHPEDVIDNDEVDEDGDDHSNVGGVELSDGGLSSDEERTDNDLIYDSMEDFGSSSGNEDDLRALRN